MLGNLSGEKQTTTELEMDGFVRSDLGFMAFSFNQDLVHKDVTIRFNGGKITQMAQGDKASTVHVTVGKNQSIYGDQFDQIPDLVLEEEATLTLADKRRKLGQQFCAVLSSTMIGDRARKAECKICRSHR